MESRQGDLPIPAGTDHPSQDCQPSSYLVSFVPLAMSTDADQRLCEGLRRGRSGHWRMHAQNSLETMPGVVRPQNQVAD